MRSSPTAKPAMPPEAPAGEDAHFRALESLYAAAPINGLFESRLTITGPGTSRIDFTIEPRHFHSAGAAHGTSYSKILDDAAFYRSEEHTSELQSLMRNSYDVFSL